MKEKMKPGSTVKLKSGGPKMVVERLWTADIECAYHCKKKGIIIKIKLGKEALKLLKS